MYKLHRVCDHCGAEKDVGKAEIIFLRPSTSGKFQEKGFRSPQETRSIRGDICFECLKKYFPLFKNPVRKGRTKNGAFDKLEEIYENNKNS